jgi:lipooligosaccharide transport system permease protein
MTNPDEPAKEEQTRNEMRSVSEARAESFSLPKLTYRVWKVWRRNYDVFIKTFKVSFFPPLLEPIFYLAALGAGLGALTAGSANLLGGQTYYQFITPALISITIMYSSFFECTYGSFVRMYYQRTFDGIIATPISVEEVIGGEILWGATRALIGSAIVLAVVAAFDLVIKPPLITSPLFIFVLPIAFCSGLLFSSIGLCFTALAPNIDFFNYPQFLFITPMFLLSSTFFPLSLLPKPLQIFSEAILPLTHTVNLTKWSIFGNGTLSFALSLLWIAIIAPFFFVLAINLMKKRLIK